MKRRHLLATLFLAALSSSISAHEEIPDSLYKGAFVNKDMRINLVIDLYGETIGIPGLDFLGKTHGYMNGNIYGIWMVTSCTMTDGEATLSLSNDQGSDTQAIRLTPTEDGKIRYETIGGNEVKRVEGRKLVKIPSTLLFERK